MRRPHPRFDTRRNAWVTEAGGHLTILVSGPKNADTETAAWNAFYQHMAKLGRPVEQDAVAPTTLGQLADNFGEWMKREVATGRKAESTLKYYRHQLQMFLDRIGGNRPALSILPHEVEMYKTTWHSVQAVQRLYNWGLKMRLVNGNPFAHIEKPELGQRERILSPEETVRLLWAADCRDFRLFLVAMRHTIARPQQIRALQWKHLVYEPVPMFVLREFKAKNRRRDRKSAVRTILLDDRMLRLLARLARKRQPQPDDFIFLNRRGEPWSGSAVRQRMSRLREKVGLTPDEKGEAVVCYTLRHTSGTNAAVNGIRDKVLAELMGHAGTRTTQRYVHPQAEHLRDAIKRVHCRRRA